MRAINRWLVKSRSAVKTHIQKSPTYSWLKTNSLPGFYGVTIYEVVSFIRKEIDQQELMTRANSMAFSFFLSLFPLLILLFTLLPYFPIYVNFNTTIESFIKELLPGNAGRILFRFIQDLTTRPRSNLLSFSFILVMFFASNGVMAMMRGFEKSYPTTFEKWSPWHKRIRSMFLTFLLAAILIASVVLIIVGNLLLNWVLDLFNISQNGFTSFALHSVRWMAIILLFYTGISAIFRFAVSARRRFRFFTPGASLATILSLLTSYIFSFYVDNFSSYNKLYGSIGTVIAIMLWIQLNAFILLVGFELNASIAITRDRNIMKEHQDLI